MSIHTAIWIKGAVKTAGLTVAGMLALSACAGTSSTTAGDSASPSSSSSSAAFPASASSSASASGAGTTSGAYNAAPWALPISEAGDKLGSMKGGSFSVDIYQVATDVASTDSMFVDKETKENLLKKGAPVVYLNYVVTNTSPAEIRFSTRLITPNTKYDDWGYLGSMASDPSSDQFAKHGLTNTGYKPLEVDPFELGPGESFNLAENFAYISGKEATVNAIMTPVNTNGNLDSSRMEEAETTITLK